MRQGAHTYPGKRIAGGLVLLLVMAVAFVASAPYSRADVQAGAKHDMSSQPGYGFGQAVCGACHAGHYAQDDRIWTEDKESPSDGLRDLAAAKLLSADQSAGGNYPGIYLCLDCHGSSSRPSWAAAAATIKTHSTREMQAVGYATKYGTFVVECTVCHDPHKHWDGSFQSGVNGYMIRDSIQTPNSGTKTVVFDAITGPGSMGTNTSPFTAVCEVCHTQTLFHKNTASTAHNDGKNCLACHSHTGGFSATDCDVCHGDPPLSYATLVGRAGNPGSAPTGSPTEGKHGFHVYSTSGGTGYSCYVCHRGGMGDGEGEDKELDIRFNAFGQYTSGGFDGFTPVSGYTFSVNNTTGGTLECFNTYCHGNFAGGIAANRPVWDNASTGGCGTCHGIAPPALQDHSVHITAAWGPRASCDDCHAAGSNTGSHADHVNGNVRFKDGQDLANTTVCNGCHATTAATKPSWGSLGYRGQTSWCMSCHIGGGSVVNTQNGTGGVPVSAPNVVGDGVTYGFNVTGHGQVGITLGCSDICHTYQSEHIDGDAQTYAAASDNFQQGYRLAIANETPLTANYSSTRVSNCYFCHREDRVVGMPSEGRPSALHVHSVVAADKWYTNFRNTSTFDGKFAGNWDSTSEAGYTHDVPTNIHWNHLDDYGSNERYAWFGLPERTYDSDGDGTGDSNVTCETCHNPHGEHYPAMTLDDFSMQVFSALVNQSVNPSYNWLGNSAYSTTRCTVACHLSGDSSGTAGTKWYREPTGLSSVFKKPWGLKVEPLP